MNNNAQIEEDNGYLYQLYKAEKTLWYFNILIENKFSGYTAVKYKNEQETYVWLEGVTIEKEFYSGQLSENQNSGQVLIKNVIDWMIIEDGRLIGGYTIRHYRNTLDDEAKMNFDIDFGVRIDSGNDFFKPDLSTPEGAIIMLEKFYTDENIEGIITCKDFKMEAENMLKNSEMEITKATKTEMAEVLRLTLIEDLQSRGFPHFINIERNFILLKEKSNQRLIKEKIIFEDGTITINNFWIGFSEGEWKVLNLVED